MGKSKIGLVIPIYLKGKHNLCYEKVIRYYSKMDFDVHICGSEGEFSRSFAEPFLSDKVKYFEVPQESFCFKSSGDDVLRKKFNDSLCTLGIGYDWYCLAGADDIVSEDFYEQLHSLDANKKIMSAVSMSCPLYALDSQSNWKAYSIKLKYSDKFSLLGGVNAFSRALIFESDFKPYALKGCETGAELLTKKLGGSVIGLKGAVTMIKGGDTLNSLEKLIRVHDSVKLYKEELDYLEKLLHLCSK